ncbi:MAG: isocitrate lyase/phosphoenolpyruvate mutase family protein [Williamsia sp.]|nr:isocitrate lyase/phosphoenolpyruvate mutase family protein [Williamsia sp.]
MSAFELFYQLHHNTEPFVLANVWNVESARMAEQAGFKAIATSSGAVANSLGYADGEQIPFGELLYIVKRIKASTGIPLTVDMERGYSDDAAVLNKNVQTLLDLGVAGINLEDWQGEDLYLKKLAALKDYLEKTNQRLFINARTDAFLLKLPSPLETTVRRAQLYKEAGADGLFVTAIQDLELIRQIAAGTTLPLNIVGNSKTFSASALSGCGVKRISMAVLLYKATYRGLQKFLHEIQAQQSLSALLE